MCNVHPIEVVGRGSEILPGMTSRPNSLRRRPATLAAILCTPQAVQKRHSPRLPKRLGVLKLRLIFRMPIKTFFSWRNLVIALELIYLKMKVSVSETCDQDSETQLQIGWNVDYLI